MTTIPSDPFEPGGIAGFGKRFRNGEITSAEATGAYIKRIEALDPKLQAFEYVAKEQALQTAKAMDTLLAAGVDLGPLMGVPAAVKDLIAVDGMPTTAGSNADVSDIIGSEGGFIKLMKRCGCVILGKVTCIEFAFGTLGMNIRRTPWNPWDADIQRVPGGSSSGSGVAAAAGLCAFAIGTDTGGSVRLPAGFCGTFGIRTYPGLFPSDGMFPLVATMDTVGPLTKSAEDAAIVMSALTGCPMPTAAPFRGLRLGQPKNYFYDNLDSNYETCMGEAVNALKKAGVEVVPIDVPEASEREKYFPIALPTYALAVLGRNRFLKIRDKMDRIVQARCASGLEVKAAEFIQAEMRRFALWKTAEEKMKGLDGWVTPTMAMVAPPVADFDDVEKGMKMTLAITQATQPGSLFGLCGTSSPIQAFGSDLPVGMQILCPTHNIAEALSIGLAIEKLAGKPPLPDLSGFIA